MILPEKGYKRVSVIALYTFLAIIIATVLVKYLLSSLLPFIIAFVFAQTTRKAVLLLGKKLRFKRSFSVFIITSVILTAVFALLYYLISKTIEELYRLVETINSESITALFSDTATIAVNYIQKLFPGFSHEISEAISKTAANIDSLITALIESVLPYIGATAVSIFSALPKIFLFTGVMIIAIFYFSCDYEKINNFIKLQLTAKQKKFITELKTQFLSTIFSIIKAYTILISLTFVQLLTGFLIAGIEYPLILALIVSIIDILPVLGTGTVLIPWCAILFLTGNVKTGLCILILYVIITVTRQIAEPKVLGNSLGLHPLVTLMSMYFGLNLIGLKGLFLFPFTMIIIKNLNEKGFISLYKNQTYNNNHITKEINS